MSILIAGKIVPTEAQEQIAFVRWLDIKGILHYHVPNGFKREVLEAVKLRKMGTKPGVPDLCIPVASNKYHGLYIEMKRLTRATSSEEQRGWRDRLRKEGYVCEFAKGCDNAIEITENYMRGDYEFYK